MTQVFRTAASLVLFILGPTLQAIDLQLVCSDSVEIGSPYTVGILSKTEAESMSVGIYSLTGKEMVFARGFALNLREGMDVWCAFLGISSRAVPGDYLLEAEVTIGNRHYKYVKMIEFTGRDFIKETIPLNQDMSALRDLNDPRIREEGRQLHRLLATFHLQSQYHEDRFILPVREARESSFYGDRRTYKYSDGHVGYSVHGGLDLALPTGSPVYAGATGKVLLSAERIISGNTIVLEHMPGVFSLYYHLVSTDVKAGEVVKQGQKIGAVGMTGLATGPHLHWEIRIAGIAVEPKVLIRDPLLDKGEILSIIDSAGSELSKEGGDSHRSNHHRRE